MLAYRAFTSLTAYSLYFITSVTVFFQAGRPPMRVREIMTSSLIVSFRYITLDVLLREFRSGRAHVCIVRNLPGENTFTGGRPFIFWHCCLRENFALFACDTCFEAPLKYVLDPVSEDLHDEEDEEIAADRAIVENAVGLVTLTDVLEIVIGVSWHIWGL